MQRREAVSRADGAEADAVQPREDCVIVRCHARPGPCTPLDAYRIHALQE